MKPQNVFNETITIQLFMMVKLLYMTHLKAVIND